MLVLRPVLEMLFSFVPFYLHFKPMMNFNIIWYLLIYPHEKNSLLEACISSKKNAPRTVW